MNVRDPFNLRRNPAVDILRATAVQAASGIREKAVEVGINAIEKGKQAAEDMSFTVPKNVPSFSNPQRLAEDRLWAASGVTSRSGHRAAGGHLNGHGLLGGVQDRVGNLLDPSRNTLPMYKDKPYMYAPSHRARPLYRRKRVLGIVAVFVVCMVYIFYFSEHETFASIGQFRWWFSADRGKRVDWLKRRQRVVEAFELSWDAYERYGWGKKNCHDLSFGITASESRASCDG